MITLRWRRIVIPDSETIYIVVIVVYRDLRTSVGWCSS